MANIKELTDEELKQVNGGVDPETQNTIDFLRSRIDQYVTELYELENNGGNPQAISDKKIKITYLNLQVIALENETPFDGPAVLDSLKNQYNQPDPDPFRK